MADMRRAVRVGNRGGDVEGGFVRHFRFSKPFDVMPRAGGASSNRQRCGEALDGRGYWIIRLRGR
jgi:hypothetical protein